ncbi:hypothetical protein AAC387_Pa05g2533 [Persea americana]
MNSSSSFLSSPSPSRNGACACSSRLGWHPSRSRVRRERRLAPFFCGTSCFHSSLNNDHHYLLPISLSLSLNFFFFYCDGGRRSNLDSHDKTSLRWRIVCLQYQLTLPASKISLLMITVRAQ